MPRRVIVYSRTQPSRIIVAVIALITLLAGIWLLTPFAITTLGGPAVAVGFNVGHAVAAIINCLFCLPGLWAVRKNTPKALANGAMWLFVWYCFVTLLRFILSPMGSLVFVPTLIICLICGIVYLEQSFKARFEGKDKVGDDA